MLRFPNLIGLKWQERKVPRDDRPTCKALASGERPSGTQAFSEERSALKNESQNHYKTLVSLCVVRSDMKIKRYYFTELIFFC